MFSLIFCKPELSETKFSWFCPCCKKLFEFVCPLNFLYKDVNIFISALSGRVFVLSEIELLFFSLSCIKIYCWMVYFSFVLSGFEINISFVLFNHTDT